LFPRIRIPRKTTSVRWLTSFRDIALLLYGMGLGFPGFFGSGGACRRHTQQITLKSWSLRLTWPASFNVLWFLQDPLVGSSFSFRDIYLNFDLRTSSKHFLRYINSCLLPFSSAFCFESLAVNFSFCKMDHKICTTSCPNLSIFLFYFSLTFYCSCHNKNCCCLHSMSVVLKARQIKDIKNYKA